MSGMHVDIYTLVCAHGHAYAHTNTTHTLKAVHPPGGTTPQLPAGSSLQMYTGPLVHFPVFPLNGASLPGSLYPEGKDH